MNQVLNMLAESVQRLLADTASHRGTIEAEHKGLDDAIWQQLSGIGVVGSDASGMSIAELAVVIEAVSSAGALVPYADSEGIGRWLARAVDLDAGQKILAVAPILEREGTVVGKKGSVSLSVAGMSIPWACRADQVLFSFRSGARFLLGAKEAREIEFQSTPNIAGEPHGIVVPDSIEIDAKRVWEVNETHGPEAVMQRGALFRSVQMLGAMVRVNELTLQYSRDRKQFRRSLSDFQVIQSYLAAMAGELCAAAGLVQVAVDSVSSDDAFGAIAAAKIRVGQAARQLTQMGHQVHGAIGFTQEYPLNLWTRRLWSWREEYGNEAHWAGRLGARVVQRGADALWPDLTRRTTEASHD